MKLSLAIERDYHRLVAQTTRLGEFSLVEEAAQAFSNLIYETFQESLVLFRVFSSIPFSLLPPQDQRLVRMKVAKSDVSNYVRQETPVLSLLGSRGKEASWNERENSENFRCIPLISSDYVSSLSMLCKQFEAMSFDLSFFDSWEDDVVKKGRLDKFEGALYVRHARDEKDDRGRMIVPKQDFVSNFGVKTVLGCGGGYSRHPSIVMIFAFTNEFLSKSITPHFMNLLKSYRQNTESAVTKSAFFR